jgi:hypothetical protein
MAGFEPGTAALQSVAAIIEPPRLLQTELIFASYKTNGGLLCAAVVGRS